MEIAKNCVEPLTEQLKRGCYRIPRIQQLFANQVLAITRRYPGKRIQISCYAREEPITKKGWAHVAWCQVKEDLLEITFSLPALLSFLVALGNNPRRNELFEFCIIISYMHELDHLALGLTGGNEEKLLEEEILTWAKTCEGTLRILAEDCPEALPTGEAKKYMAWVKSGRNPQSPIWTDFIRAIYAEAEPNG